jgi:hypothetical protein
MPKKLYKVEYVISVSIRSTIVEAKSAGHAVRKVKKEVRRSTWITPEIRSVKEY